MTLKAKIQKRGVVRLKKKKRLLPVAPTPPGAPPPKKPDFYLNWSKFLDVEVADKIDTSFTKDMEKRNPQIKRTSVSKTNANVTKDLNRKTLPRRKIMKTTDVMFNAINLKHIEPR